MAQTFSWNGFEATALSPITAGSSTISLDSSVGLRAPGYLVIDPESPTKREYILFNTLNGATLENVSRGLDGSISGAQEHEAGVKIRAVSMHQMFDDLWQQINQGDTDLATHIADSGDPHAAAAYLKLSSANLLYLPLDGGVAMAGDIDMGGNRIGNILDGTVDDSVVTKKYIDDADTANSVADQAYTDAEIVTHAAVTDAHHARYTDAEAEAAAPVQEAPADGKTYGRKDSAWAEVAAPDLSNYYTKAEVDSLLNGKAPTIHNHTAAQITSGVLDVGRIPDLNANKITAGTFKSASVYTFPGGLTVAGTMGVGGGFELPNIAQNVGTHALRINNGTGVVTYN